MKLRSLMGGVCALALPVHAAVLTETDFLADLPVVLTVSKMAQPLQDSPSSVTVIDQDMIRASGYQDIPDLLRLVPGFSVAYTRNNTYAIGYHGFADAYSRRFQVLVDGRSIYSPHYGEVGWTSLPLALEDIDRIEVVRGPNSAVYGANAFFAVINIITKDPSLAQGKLLTALAGENNMAGGMFRYGGASGDLRYRLTLSSQHRDRHEKTFDDTTIQNADERLYERTYTRFFNGRWDYRLSNTDVLSAQLGLTGGDWNQGNDRSPLTPRRAEPFDGFVQLRFARAAGPDEEWNVQFSHSYSDNGKESFIGLFEKGAYKADSLVRPNLKQSRTQLDFSSVRKLGADLRVMLGGELRHEAVKGSGFYGTGETLDGVLANLFAHAEWSPNENWVVQGGSLIGRHYFTGFEFSPRLAVNYKINPRHTVRWAVSRATRSPTFYEQKGDSAIVSTDNVVVDQDVVPSAELESEVNVSTEIGYIGRWPEWGGQLDVRLHRDHVTRYIANARFGTAYPLDDPLTPGVEGYSDKVFHYVNGGSIDVAGLDLQFSWKPHKDFSLHLMQSFVHIEADRSAMEADKDLPESSPDWITSLLANWRVAQGLYLSAAVYRTDRMTWLTEGDKTKSYTRADLRLAKQFKLDGVDAEWAVGVQNLGDDYEEFRRNNLFSRRAYGTLRFAW